MESVEYFEKLNRRTLIQWMALASPAVFGAACSLVHAGGGPSIEAASTGPQHGRPRLFYNSGSLERIRQMLSSDAAADAFLKKHGDELLGTDFVPETVAEIGGGQQANYIQPSTQIAEMGLTLGLLFHLTGEQKYAAKLRDGLLYYGHYVRWAGPQLIERIPPWHSELDTTTFSFGYSTGYDALRSFLSDTDRKTIADIMVRLAVMPTLNDWILPGARIHSLDSMGHNWWGVCVAGAGLCALALLGDEPRAQSWIDAVDAGYVEWFDYRGNVLQNRMRTFERTGASYEGVNYTNYGVSQYLHYRLAWQNTFPGQKAAHIEPLDHVGAFFLHTLYPTSTGFMTVNFDDAPPAVDVTETLLLLAACGLATPDASRYLSHVHTNPQGTLLTLLKPQTPPATRGDAPTSCIYPDMGWATMRTSWENDATFIAMKAGYTWNHAHADAGSFILFKQGKPLIIDSGTCQYSRSEYSTYYRLSRAHNVVLFNGQGQAAEDIGLGCKFQGRMHSLIDGHDLKYIYADATGPMARWFTRNYRRWIWSGDVILIIDDLRAHTPGEMDWLLHFEGEYTADSDSSVTLRNGGAEAVVKVLYPGVKHREEIGLKQHDPDKKVPYLAFYPDVAAQSRQFITAICLNPNSVPKFEVLEDPNYLGLRMEVQGAIEEVYLSRRAIATPGTMCVRINAFMTDAYLVHLRRASSSAAVERYFVSDGSYLRRGDQSILESLSKVTACWSPSDSLDVFSDETSNSIQIVSEHLPKSIRWNGIMTTAGYDKEQKLVSLKRTNVN
jgi:oligo-alginate lyase